MNPYLCFCYSVPRKLHHGKVTPPYGLLDLVEADFEGGAPCAVAGGLVHADVGAVRRAIKAHHHSY